MGSTLYFQPRQTGEHSLSDQLKLVLRDGKHFGGLPHTATERDIPYFEALADAGVKDAQKVLDAIEKYGELELRLEY